MTYLTPCPCLLRLFCEMIPKPAIDNFCRRTQVTRAYRIACLLAVLAIAIAGIAIFSLRAGQAQESVSPASPRSTDFTPRSIPQERRTTMSQATEVVAGVDAKTVPQFQVDPFWPKPLPNNWLVGQVAGVHVDKRDHIWIIHRPASLDRKSTRLNSSHLGIS